MDVVAESLRDDLRIFADAIGLHSDRLNRHDARIGRPDHWDRHEEIQPQRNRERDGEE